MTLKEYFAQYEQAHRHPANRFFHTLGIPSIIVSIVLIMWTPYREWGWILFIVGWFLQFIGHAVERTWPEFMKNPVFLVIGPLYFANKIFKRSK